MLSKLTRAPRVVKVLIVLGTDSLLGVIAVWSAVLLRAAGIPKFLMLQVIVMTIMTALVVPFAGMIAGMYRSVLRFPVPSLNLRAACVAVMSAASLGGLGWLGGTAYHRVL